MTHHFVLTKKTKQVTQKKIGKKRREKQKNVMIKKQEC